MDENAAASVDEPSQGVTEEPVQAADISEIEAGEIEEPTPEKQAEIEEPTLDAEKPAETTASTADTEPTAAVDHLLAEGPIEPEPAVARAPEEADSEPAIDPEPAATPEPAADNEPGKESSAAAEAEADGSKEDGELVEDMDTAEAEPDVSAKVTSPSPDENEPEGSERAEAEAQAQDVTAAGKEAADDQQETDKEDNAAVPGDAANEKPAVEKQPSLMETSNETPSEQQPVETQSEAPATDEQTPNASDAKTAAAGSEAKSDASDSKTAAAGSEAQPDYSVGNAAAAGSEAKPDDSVGNAAAAGSEVRADAGDKESDDEDTEDKLQIAEDSQRSSPQEKDAEHVQSVSVNESADNTNAPDGSAAEKSVSPSSSTEATPSSGEKHKRSTNLSSIVAQLRAAGSERRSKGATPPPPPNTTTTTVPATAKPGVSIVTADLARDQPKVSQPASSAPHAAAGVRIVNSPLNARPLMSVKPSAPLASGAVDRIVASANASSSNGLPHSLAAAAAPGEREASPNDHINNPVEFLSQRLDGLPPYKRARPSQQVLDAVGPDFSADGYPCSGCGDVFSLKTTRQIHEERKSMIIELVCAVCKGRVVCYNRCQFFIHALKHQSPPKAIFRNIQVRSMTDKELSMALEGWFTSEAFARAKDSFKLYEYEFGREVQLQQPTGSDAAATRSLPPSATAAHKLPAAQSTASSSSSSQAAAAADRGGVSLSCYECNRTFDSSRLLRAHFARNQQKQMICSQNGCQAVYFSSCAMAAHRRAHLNSEPHVCAECGLKFSSSVRLSAHLCEHRNNPTAYNAWRCTRCSMFYSNINTVITHCTVAHCTHKWTCKLCNRLLKDQASLLSHLSTAHQQQVTGKGDAVLLARLASVAIDCYDQQCGHRALARDAMLEHLRHNHYTPHKHIKPFLIYRCPMCGRLLENKPGLASHLERTHQMGIPVDDIRQMLFQD